MGYNSVQLSGQSREIPDEQVAEMLAETGMTCSATHQSFEEMETQTDALIKRHKLWKCAYPGVGSMPKEFHGSAEGFAAFAKRVNPIADKLKDNGLTFVYHNHAFEFSKFDGRTGMDILFDNLNQNAQFELDVFWVQTGGASPVEWIEKVNGRMDVVHYKDMAIVCDQPWQQTQTMAPVGTGNINFQSVMAACARTHVKYALVEQDNAVETDPLGCMKTSHDNLVKLGGRF